MRSSPMRGERREHALRARRGRRRERFEPARLETLEVLVERIHEDPERHVALELGRGPGEHELARARPRARRAPTSRRDLPIPGSPVSSSAPRTPALELRDALCEHAELVGAPDEMLGTLSHSPPPSCGPRASKSSGYRIRVSARCAAAAGAAAGHMSTSLRKATMSATEFAPRTTVTTHGARHRAAEPTSARPTGAAIASSLHCASSRSRWLRARSPP